MIAEIIAITASAHESVKSLVVLVWSSANSNVSTISVTRIKCEEMCDHSHCDQPSQKKNHVLTQALASGGKSALTCAQSATRTKFEILFGVKGEDDARFIQLQNCKHMYKVSGLDQWMDVTT